MFPGTRPASRTSSQVPASRGAGLCGLGPRAFFCEEEAVGPGVSEGSYLVDPASSHMLVSKIKPCMSKYKLLYCETANGSLNQL